MIYRKTYPGSAPEPYDVWFDDETDGRHCPCMSFRFSKDIPASCKHTKNLVTIVQNGTWTPDGDAGTAIATTADRLPPATDTPVLTARTRPMLADALPDGCRFKDGQIRWPEVLKRFGSMILEPKLDGERIMGRVSTDASGRKTAVCWSRPRAKKGGGQNEPGVKDLPKQLIDALCELPDCIIDGEVLVPGGTSSDVKRGGMRNNTKLRIALFDILEINGCDIKDEPWHRRREALALAVEHHTKSRADVNEWLLWLVPTAPVSKEACEAIWNSGGEGAIIKNQNALYRPNYRSKDWIKVKREATIDTIITGYEAGEEGPYSKVKSVCADGTPVSVKTKNANERKKIAADPEGYKGRTLVVEYTERTPPSAEYPNGRLRHPRYDHIKNQAD